MFNVKKDRTENFIYNFYMLLLLYYIITLYIDAKSPKHFQDWSK